jgi:hypothetical protein
MKKHPIDERAVVTERVAERQAPLAILIPAAVFLLLALAGAALWTGGSGEQNFSVRDSFFWLNSGWRILHGQVPHTDFSLTTGTFLGYVAAVGMRLHGPGVDSIAAGQALLGLAAAPVGYLVLRRRTTPTAAAAGALFAGLLMMATRQPGEAFDERSHAFLYNRIAESLLAIFAWIALMPPRRPHAMADALEYLAAGFLFVLLAFTKISYGVIACALLGLSLVQGRLTVRAAGGGLVGFLLAGTWLTAGLDLSPTAWLHDVTQPFRMGYGGTQLGRVLPGVVKGMPSLVILTGLLALASTHSAPRDRIRLALVTTGTWALSVVITIASQQRQEYLLPISIALILHELARAGSPPGRSRIASALLTIMILPQVGTDARSIGASWLSSRRAPLERTHIAAPGLADFRLAANKEDFADELNEGLGLVTAHTPPDAPVQALDYADPVAFALHRPPPVGGVVFWYPKFNFSSETHPDPALVFHGAPWVLLTRRPYDRGFFDEIYGAWLDSNYVVVAESPRFHLLRPQE